MSHEPECLATYDPSPFFHKPTEPYCSCEAIRAAYQRGREDADRWCNIADIAYRKGREDAAKAVETALNDYMYGEECGPPEFRLIAAARGGEQDAR